MLQFKHKETSQYGSGLYLDQAFDGLSEHCRLLMKDRLANEH